MLGFYSKEAALDVNRINFESLSTSQKEHG